MKMILNRSMWILIITNLWIAGSSSAHRHKFRPYFHERSRGLINSNKFKLLQQLLNARNVKTSSSTSSYDPETSEMSHPIIPWAFWEHVRSLMVELEYWNIDRMKNIMSKAISTADIRGLRFQKIQDLFELFGALGEDYVKMSYRERYQDYISRLRIRMYGNSALSMHALFKPTNSERTSYQNTEMMRDIKGCIKKLIRHGDPSVEETWNQMLKRHVAGCEYEPT